MADLLFDTKEINLLLIERNTKELLFLINIRKVAKPKQINQEFSRSVMLLLTNLSTNRSRI